MRPSGGSTTSEVSREACLAYSIHCAGAAAASHLLNTFLFGVSAFDPLVLTLTAAVVLLLTLIASLLPANRAASVDLIQTLRAE